MEWQADTVDIHNDDYSNPSKAVRVSGDIEHADRGTPITLERCSGLQYQAE